MKAKWLLETDIFDENLTQLVGEIRRQDMEVKIASYAPLQSGQTYLNLFEPTDCVVYYGSINFGLQIKREAKWIPGVWYERKNYECTSYYPWLGKYLLNSDYVMLPFGELGRCRDFLFETIGDADCLFLRPNSCSKVFTGHVVERDRYDIEVPRLSWIDKNELVLVSSPKNLLAEWRFVIVDGKPVAGSRYKHTHDNDVDPSYPCSAWDLAAEAASCGWQPDRAWTLDVGLTKQGSYRVIEIGTFSCAGLYACNLEPIVREVSRAAIEEWNEYQ